MYIKKERSNKWINSQVQLLFFIIEYSPKDKNELENITLNFKISKNQEKRYLLKWHTMKKKLIEISSNHSNI